MLLCCTVPRNKNNWKLLNGDDFNFMFHDQNCHYIYFYTYYLETEKDMKYFVISLGTLQEEGWIVGVEINVTFCGN